MTIRVLGGVAKGLILKVPPGATIRPTLVLLRRRIFDSVQNLEGRVFVDAFAGTGAIGLEAWSRGAKNVWLIEKEKAVYSILQANVKNLQAKFSAELALRPVRTFQGNFKTWSSGHTDYLLNSPELVVFIDPPYEMTQLYCEALEYFQQRLLPGQEIWVESDRQKGISLEEILTYPYDLIKLYEQGTSFIARLRNRT